MVAVVVAVVVVVRVVVAVVVVVVVAPPLCYHYATTTLPLRYRYATISTTHNFLVYYNRTPPFHTSHTELALHTTHCTLPLHTYTVTRLLRKPMRCGGRMLDRSCSHLSVSFLIVRRARCCCARSTRCCQSALFLTI